MREQKREIHQIYDPELNNRPVGLFAGQIVTVIQDWKDANHRLHYSVRLPNGDVNPNVPEDQISFDKDLIYSISHK